MNTTTEQIIEDALTRAGIEFQRHNAKELDFFLPTLDIYIEVKDMHSPRIAAQMERAKNVIAIQGIAAAVWFANIMSYVRPVEKISEEDWKKIHDPHKGFLRQEHIKEYNENQPPVYRLFTLKCPGCGDRFQSMERS